MKIVSAKQFSILGIVLIAASAVTAAIVPTKDKSNKEKLDFNGRLVPSVTNPDQLTCKPGENPNCHDTASAGTNPLSLTTNASDESISNATSGMDVS